MFDPTTLVDPESRYSLNRRSCIGERCIALAFDGPWTSVEEVEGEDRETHAKDAISDILTALYGPSGAHTTDGTFVANPEANEEAARALLRDALESWAGDAEDYTVE